MPSLVFSKEKNINIPCEKRGLGFVFQDFALWPHMSVFDNVAFGLRAGKDTENLEQRVMDALRSVKLEEFSKRYPHQLSGGQQQRVAFARAIVIKPECILFDEPLSALDALLREQMRKELKYLVSNLHITSIFVTHDQSEAMSMSDKIAVLDGGNIAQYDDPETIYNHPKTSFVARFIGKSNWINDKQLFRIEDISTTPNNNYYQYDLTISSVQYLGDTYEVMADYQDNKWTIHLDHKPDINEKLTIYLDPNKIITC